MVFTRTITNASSDGAGGHGNRSEMAMEEYPAHCKPTSGKVFRTLPDAEGETAIC